MPTTNSEERREQHKIILRPAGEREKFPDVAQSRIVEPKPIEQVEPAEIDWHFGSKEAIRASKMTSETTRDCATVGCLQTGARAAAVDTQGRAAAVRGQLEAAGKVSLRLRRRLCLNPLRMSIHSQTSLTRGRGFV
jgi:hypothetical protein